MFNGVDTRSGQYLRICVALATRLRRWARAVRGSGKPSGRD